MVTKSVFNLMLACAYACLGLTTPSNARAQDLRMAATSAEISLSPHARGELARKFVMKWGGYVERNYGVSVNIWAQRMVQNFVAADPTNLRGALMHDSFEESIAELSGTRSKSTNRLLMVNSVQSAYSIRPKKALGDSVRDLVYTPLLPCRIVDTRITASGVIPANSTRSFLALNGSYTAQGGSGSGCGVSGLSSVGAVAINVTAVTPSDAGYATVFSFDSNRPNTASINYTAGSIVNNTIVTAIPSPLLNSDFTIYTFAQSHYVVDIVGYFAAPAATQLQCSVGDSRTNNVLSGGQASVFPPPCPLGFSAVSSNCIASSSQVSFSEVTITACTARNSSSSSHTITGAYTCCRVPGR